MKENILGYQVDTLSVAACADDVFAHVVRGHDKRWFACLNPHSYAVTLEDAHFALALRGASWLVPDGIGMVHASRWLGGNIKERVTGSDVFFGLHERMNTHGQLSVFFLGATDDTLEAIRVRMSRDYPDIRVAGTYSPPFKPDYTAAELDAMINSVNAAKPDVLWVGMTAPKQEKWIAQNIYKLDVRFAGAIGAVFDFYTGKVQRSHPIFQKLGLEWLPRLVQQPRRLWRRMFISAPVFVAHVIAQIFKTEKSRKP